MIVKRRKTYNNLTNWTSAAEQLSIVFEIGSRAPLDLGFTNLALRSPVEYHIFVSHKLLCINSFYYDLNNKLY